MPFTTPSDADVVASGLAAWLANGIGPIEFDGLPGVEYSEATEWPVFIGPDVPPTPDRVVVITALDAPRRVGTIEQGVQVRLRGSEWSDAWQVRACAQAIVDYCTPNGFPRVHVNLGSVRVGMVQVVSQTAIGSDDRNRPGYTVNLRIRYRKPLPLDGVPPFLPMPEPVIDLDALEEHIADETPHPVYDGEVDFVQDIEGEY